MINMARLTKAQKAGLVDSKVKAQAGHYVPVLGSGEPVGQHIEDPDAKIKSDILTGIDSAIERKQQELSDQFEAEAKDVIRSIQAGGVATITGDLKRGFLRDSHGRDHPFALVTAMVDTGLLVLTDYPHHMNSLYHLAASRKAIDWLNEATTVEDAQRDEQSF